MSGKEKPEKPRPIGIDTNIFIYFYYQHPQFGAKAAELFHALANNHIQAVTSIISLIELLSFSASPSKLRALEESFIATPNLRIMEVEHAIGVAAARLRRHYGIRLPDAIQLATSLMGGAKGFVTNDRGLGKVKEIEVVMLNELTERFSLDNS